MFPYTKILEVPIVLHKKINDEDILLFTKSYGTTYVYVIDRNDLQKDPNYNMNYQYIDISKIQSTIIKEPFYFGHEMVCYKYLDTTNEVGDDEDFYMYKNETINAIKLSNETFITKSYLKHRIVCKLEKRGESYSLCYYYNDKCLNQFFDARRKDYILIYLLERAEKQRIINNSLEGLNKILTCKLPNNSKISYKSKDLDSSVIFKESIKSDMFNASLHCSFRNTFKLKLLFIVVLLFVVLFVLFVILPILGIILLICSCCPLITFIISLLSFINSINISLVIITLLSQHTTSSIFAVTALFSSRVKDTDVLTAIHVRLCFARLEL